MQKKQNQSPAISYSLQLGIIIFVVAFMSSFIIYSSRPDVQKSGHDLSMIELSGNYFSVALENEEMVFETYSYMPTDTNSMIYNESE